MGKHLLSLEVPETLNECILRVIDSSVYDENLPVSCPRLLISIPGFPTAYFVEDIATGFSLNLTACQLSIQTEHCGTEFNSLPDGIYVLKYSVSPHDVVYVEYNHLRTTNALKKLRKVYCGLDMEDCAPSAEMKKKREQARDIHDMLRAAKAMVEDCRSATKGLAVYKEALRLLNKMDCKHCH